MINYNAVKKRCLAALLAGIMLVCTSCGSEEIEEQKTSHTVSTKIAEPAVGIGREIKEETEPEPAKPNGYTICVDPGHGFVDGGTGDGVFEDGVLEKDINLAVSKLLVEELEILGYNTIMTHDGVNMPVGDVDKNHIFNVSERSAYANTLDIDYYVSIHVNAIEDTSVYGMQIYYEQNGNKVNNWSEEIAQDIAESLEATFPDYKKPQIWDDKTLEVTRETKAAASLIEIGFCTNEVDRNNMINPDWQDIFARAVAKGINEFFSNTK